MNRHPIGTIMGALAVEEGLDVDAINASPQHRAVVTLLVELLDRTTPPILVHPETVPTAACTLRAYARLLEVSTEAVEAVPAMRALRDAMRDGMDEALRIDEALRTAEARTDGGPG